MHFCGYILMFELNIQAEIPLGRQTVSIFMLS